MKFGVLALDYDGTIARDGVLDPDVRAAIEEVRKRDIISVLVTGRILTDLRRLMGDLRLFDCVVAENGAVVAFPNAGRSTAHGHSPTQAFLEELSRRGITFARGECVVEADAELACQTLSVIREMELPLVVLLTEAG
ncbi:MAG TPA: HAD hydrolase family protein [Blastocatellia bacterium]|nr:HAD hydrolase family protein [Blastocatellia bacterium]